VIVIDLTCERVAIAQRRNCASSLCARPLFTSPVGGEPVACLFDSVSRQKTYEPGSWSGHETGQVGVGPAAVYTRVAYSCAYGAGLCPLGVSSAHRPSFSGHTLLCVPHIEK
jgi:hypothetical protein